jgi:hypothetical protein
MTTLNLRNSIGRSPLRLGFLLIPLVLACFALSPTAQATPKPAPTPTPGATSWYVPGISDAYNLNIYSVYFIINPGIQAGVVTLTFVSTDGSEVDSQSATVQPKQETVLESIGTHPNTPNDHYNGYMVITSEVPVIVQAWHQLFGNQNVGGVEGSMDYRLVLNAYPAP